MLQSPPSVPAAGFWQVPDVSGGAGSPTAPGGGPPEDDVDGGSGRPTAPGGGPLDDFWQVRPVLHFFVALHAAPSDPSARLRTSSSDGPLEPSSSSEVQAVRTTVEPTVRMLRSARSAVRGIMMQDVRQYRVQGANVGVKDASL
jgi:hypothetical protein